MNMNTRVRRSGRLCRAGDEGVLKIDNREAMKLATAAAEQGDKQVRRRPGAPLHFASTSNLRAIKRQRRRYE